MRTSENKYDNVLHPKRKIRPKKDHFSDSSNECGFDEVSIDKSIRIYLK